MNQVNLLLKSIKDKKVSPIYLLMGDEPFFIDHISAYMANNLVPLEAQGFDQTVVYGKDTNIEDIVALAKRFPMLAPQQLIIVKEAQHLTKSLDVLEAYAKKPQNTTILVLCYKYKKIDKRKTWYKAIKSNGVVFESKALREYQLANWINTQVQEHGYTIDPRANAMLADFLGTDLGKLHNELQKLYGLLQKTTKITPVLVEKNIGISKDYNNFELQNAIGAKNKVKAMQIINYFIQNPKAHPFVLVITVLQRFFTQLLQYHGMPNKANEAAVAKALGINPYFIKDYKLAARNYPMRTVSNTITKLRNLDLKGKGLGAKNLPAKDLFYELFYEII